MPFLLSLAGSLGLMGCAAQVPQHASTIDSPTYHRLPAESRLPAGVGNMARNTGNSPQMLNPHALSD